MSAVAPQAETVEITDGSTVKDEKALTSVLKSVASALVELVSIGQKSADLTFLLATGYASARSLIRDGKGLPVWNQTAYTDEYRAKVGAVEATAFAPLRDSDGKFTPEGKQISDGIKNAARKMMARNGILEAALVAYVLSEVVTEAEAAKVTKWTEEKNHAPSVPAAPKETPAFCKAVAKEYRRCNLPVPPKYGGVTKDKDTGETSDAVTEENTAAALDAAIVAMTDGKFSAYVVAMQLHRACTAFADAAPDIKAAAYSGKREETGNVLLHASAELHFAASVVHNKNKDGDAAARLSSGQRFTPEMLAEVTPTK